MEEVFIDNLFEDAQNNIDTGYAIEAVNDPGVVMMKISRENKTTAYFWSVLRMKRL